MANTCNFYPFYVCPNSRCIYLQCRMIKWYCVTKIVLTYCSSDQEKLLKFKAEGRDFEIFLRSLEKFIQTVQGQNIFW